MVLLSTGAVEDNSKMNIYDLAGNVWEWTLEKSNDSDDPCAVRGGYFIGAGSSFSANKRDSRSTATNSYNFGFRPALY